MNDPRQPAPPSGHPTQLPQPQHSQQGQTIPRPATQPPQIRPAIGQPAPSIQPRPAGAPAPRPAVAPPRPVASPQDDAIALVEELAEVDDRPAAAPPVSKIKFGPEMGHKKHVWKRQTHVTGTGACRVRSFHAKYSEQGVEHLDDMINEWLDDHPEVEVKFVTQSVHVFEGKIREPALVLNVWY